jgi:hypothetical protein
MKFLLSLFIRSKVGTALIDATIAEFESFAQKLEDGAKHNSEKVGKNSSLIAALSAENTDLNAAHARALSVASKLRSLVS